MKVTYNPDEDKLRILFCNAPIQESEAHRSGLILDYDQNGRIVGLELSDASEQMSVPYTVNFAERAFTLAAGGSQTEEDSTP
ncbi:MAG: DUF2283 domain-containing protein [Capsulimonas sp.]|uniref:DUF2283 domain-containing protein n=1 Tax=Capsulimonas sp. TaxID=2494211 RepID=UPI003265D727